MASKEQGKSQQINQFKLSESFTEGHHLPFFYSPNVGWATDINCPIWNDSDVQAGVTQGFARRKSSETENVKKHYEAEKAVVWELGMCN